MTKCPGSSIKIIHEYEAGNFHLIEKTKISKSKSGSYLSKTISISEIEQKACLCSIVDQARDLCWDTRLE